MTREERDNLEDALITLSRAISALNLLESMHSCNDCSKVGWWAEDGVEDACEYGPEWGNPVRYNCPFWEGGKEA